MIKNVTLGLLIYFFAVGCVLLPAEALAQTSQPAWQAEWGRILEAAKKEGKVVVSIPASAELRKGMEEALAKEVINQPPEVVDWSFSEKVSWN